MRVLIRLLRALLPLIVIGVAGLVAVTMVRNRPEVETQAPTVEPPGVRAHLVTLETVRISVGSQGTVRPRTETQLVPQIAGRITSVSPSFVEGGFFEEGDVLLRLDRFDYEQAIVSARSQLAQARLQLAQEEAEAEVAQREWDTLGRGDPRELTLRVPQLEDARASVAAAEANVERAERDLERADVVAPYSGRVRTKSVDVGQFVTVGAPIATVYAIDVAEVGLALPDGELAYLDLPLAYRGAADQVGPRVVLRTTFAGASHEWSGRVVRTTSEIDPVSRMVQVVAEVQDPYAASSDPRRPPLAVGMYVEAEIEGRAFGNIAVVPRAALRGRNQVIVIDSENRVRFREVGVLRTTTDSVYINSGLSAGELVAVSAVDSPTEGMLVQVTNLDLEQLASAPTPVESASPEPTTEARAAEPTAPAPEPESQQPGWLRELLNDAPAPPARSERRADADTSASPARRLGDRAAAESPPPRRDTPTRRVAAPDAPATPPPAEPVEAAPDVRSTVAVLPFEDITRDARDAEFGADVTQSVTTRLEGIGDIAVVPSASEARLVVDGGVQRLGDLVRVTARVVDQRDGGVVGAVKIDGTASELPRVRAEVAVAIGDSIVDALAGRRPADIPTRAATSAVALRPFANVSAMPEDAEFADAIFGALSERLGSLQGVNLVATEPDADWIVDGAIQRVGNVIRVTANLIDATAGSMASAVKIDGVVSDLASVRDEVAAAVRDSVVDTLNIDADEPMAAVEAPPAAILVRPFSNVSQMPEDAALADAISRAVTERLRTVQSVSVVADEQDAMWIISGGIQRLGNTVRITANLIDTTQGSVVRAVKVDGPVDQLSRLQDEVAAELSNSVREATS